MEIRLGENGATYILIRVPNMTQIVMMSNTVFYTSEENIQKKSHCQINIEERRGINVHISLY